MMTRNRFFGILLAAVALVTCTALATRSIVRADLPQSTATQIYQPDFQEWAFLYLTAAYRDYSSQTHFVSVAEQTINGKLRFKILGTYTKTPGGQAWYDNIGSKIRASIEADCRRWTAGGFPIGLNDFQIDIHQS
jgi:hypothetical protein